MNIYYKKQLADQTQSYFDKVKADAKKPVIKYTDPTNNPGLVILGALYQNGTQKAPGVELPGDVAIYINGEKIIAESQILDGVVVFEHIARKPYDIEFEMVLRTKQGNDYIFPQAYIQKIWADLWIIDGVISIQNTYLNGLGVSQMVIFSIEPTTVRGSTNMPLRIKGKENQSGLLITG
jgi:hypothetical protein